MRRFFSFFLLLLILLNTFGYYQLLTLIENDQSNRFSSKIDRTEDEISGNLLLRIPLAAPYWQDDDEYQKAKGEVFIEGQLYHFVKRKMYHDTLYIVCLKDARSTETHEAISEYSKSFADQLPKDGTAKTKNDSALSLLYLLSESVAACLSNGWVLNVENKIIEDLYHFASIDAIFHPPCRAPFS